ncbi:MAG: protein phosphatase 2C domain-containing protein [Microthrixaceae bacterium]
MSDEDRPAGPFDGLRLIAGSASLVGKVRAANEDSLLVSSDVLVVADGMGGHLAGEVASARAVEILAEAEGHRSLVELVSAVHLANRRISDSAAEDPALRGMGTTICVVGQVDEDGEHLAILNVGDSRVYLLADGELNQLTEDHSLVETLVREGRITPAEAEVHPQRNVLTRALGVEALVLVDAWLLLPCDGDRLLLCSDGLFNELSVERITEILQDQDDPDVAARRLAAEAEAAGGRDNITTVVADVIGSGRPPAPYDDRYRRIATPAVDFDDPFRDASSDTATVPLVPIIAVPPRNDDPDAIEEGDDGKVASDETGAAAASSAAASLEPDAPAGAPDAPAGAADAPAGAADAPAGTLTGPGGALDEALSDGEPGATGDPHSDRSDLDIGSPESHSDPSAGDADAEFRDEANSGAAGDVVTSAQSGQASGHGSLTDASPESSKSSLAQAVGDSDEAEPSNLERGSDAEPGDEDDGPGNRGPGDEDDEDDELAEDELTVDQLEVGEEEGVDEGGRTWRTPVFIVAVILVIAAAIGAIAVAVRSGWYVGADGNSVVIYKGPVRTLPILGDSIVERFPDIHVDELPQNKRSKVDAGTRFSTESTARRFVRTLDESSTSTTSSTTTSTTPTTLRPPTTAQPPTTAATTTLPTTTVPGAPAPGASTPGGNGP